MAHAIPITSNVKVDQKYLTIEGTRALYFFSNTGSAATFPKDRKHPAEKVLVTLLFEQPRSSIDDAPASSAAFSPLLPKTSSIRHPRIG
jgi:hypothetical protein